MDKTGSQSVVVVDETLAKRQFANTDPIGQHLRVDDSGAGPREVEISKLDPVLTLKANL